MARTIIVPIDPHYFTSASRQQLLRERLIHYAHNQQQPRPAGQTGDDKQSVLVYNPDNLLLYQPKYPMSELGLLLAEALERYQWGDTFMKFVPVRLGSSRLMDCSAQALMRASNYHAGKSQVFKASSMRLYGEAIDILRMKMNSKSFTVSEEALLVVALLSAYESTMGTSLKNMFSHMQGVDALLRRSEVTEMSRAMLYHYHTITFLMPVAHGISSPYDKQKWLGLDPPAKRRAAAPSGIKLHRFSNQLFIRLPKLIVLVRKLRTSTNDHVAITAMALAQDLLKLSDQTAENEMLHLVNVTNTAHPADSYIIPVAFIFRSYADFEAMAYYWQTRLLLLRLCRKLIVLCPDKAPLMGLDALTAESARLSTNMLMAWEAAFSFGAFGTGKGGTGTTAFVNALIAVWGFLTDVDNFRGMPAEKTKAWVVQRLENLMGDVLKISRRDMDEMSDLFCGGPITGMLPALFDGEVK